MRSLRWTAEDNSVYIPEIDAQHREVFRLAGELRSAALAGAAPAELEALRHRLDQLVSGHLAHEEDLMRAAHYSAYAWHERQHQTARTRLAELKRTLRCEDREAAFESIEAFAAWLRDHTAVADRMAGAHLRNRERAERFGE